MIESLLTYLLPLIGVPIQTVIVNQIFRAIDSKITQKHLDKWLVVLGDMIEGVIVVNRLVAPVADQVRTALWAILSLRGFISTDFTADANTSMRSDQTQTRVA